MFGILIPANAAANRILVFSLENKIQAIAAANVPNHIYGIKLARHAFVAKTSPALLKKFSVPKNVGALHLMKYVLQQKPMITQRTPAFAKLSPPLVSPLKF